MSRNHRWGAKTPFNCIGFRFENKLRTNRFLIFAKYWFYWDCGVWLRFNSCHPHYSKKSGRPWKYKVSYFFVYFSAIWGTGFYKTMSRSLKEEFPSVSGFSVTNLKYIKRFFEFYKSDRYFWISVVKGSSEGDWKFTSFNRGDQEVIEGYCKRVKQDKHERSGNTSSFGL